MTNTSSGLSIC